jgi:hypothetical protein
VAIDHQSPVALKEEWITPRWITDEIGPFDLDPCAPVDPPWPISDKTYTIFDDGLKQPWEGFVWLNPPYGRKTHEWIKRLAHHGNGIGLTLARTDTKFFHDEIFDKANCVFFLKGRVNFHHVNGSRAASNVGAGSVLAGYGFDAYQRLSRVEWPGKFICLLSNFA